MKKIGMILAVCLGILSLGLFAYLGLSLAYKDVYPAFVWVEDIYCTGKTPSEINDLLLEKHNYEGLTLVDIAGQELHISPEDIDMKRSYMDYLERLLDHRGGINWWKNFLRPTPVEIYCASVYDSSKLDRIISDWDAMDVQKKMSVEILDGEDGYELKSQDQLIPDLEEVSSVARDALDKQKTRVDLSTESFHWGVSCYREAYKSDEVYHLEKLYEKIDSLQKKSYSLSLAGEEVALTREDISGFILTKNEYESEFSVEEDFSEKSDGADDQYIVDNKIYTKYEIINSKLVREDTGFMVDDDGCPVIVVNRIKDYADRMGKEYGTAHFVDRYNMGVGNETFINENKKGKGNIIDTDAEFARLMNVFTGGDYKSGSAEVKLLDGIKEYNASERLGRTFIEVDMGNQRLKYYVNGSLNMEMPIVTGNVNRGRGTPAGVYDVYNKRYHTYLRGADYVSYVNYWLGVHKGVGIHDATWRSEFGEEIYKRDGSHGCINCPKENVSLLWEVAEVGTPVILYY